MRKKKKAFKAFNEKFILSFFYLFNFVPNKSSPFRTLNIIKLSDFKRNATVIQNPLSDNA